VIDAFGHVSVRHPTIRGAIPVALALPELVEPDDILEFDLDSQPVKPRPCTSMRSASSTARSSRRPDVVAVCHHHAAAIMPFCISGDPIVPVFHLGAAMAQWRRSGQPRRFRRHQPAGGEAREAPRWRARSQALRVLMRRHGATVVGTSLRELVSAPSIPATMHAT